ncbi:MAG: hypothetical protein KDA84_27280, partial [Planctomycetaceae bacterium]|nr:hypothetical protein [Planctomycetaceae bacterium]
EEVTVGGVKTTQKKPTGSLTIRFDLESQRSFYIRYNHEEGKEVATLEDSKVKGVVLVPKWTDAPDNVMAASLEEQPTGEIHLHLLNRIAAEVPVKRMDSTITTTLQSLEEERLVDAATSSEWVALLFRSVNSFRVVVRPFKGEWYNLPDLGDRFLPQPLSPHDPIPIRVAIDENDLFLLAETPTFGAVVHWYRFNDDGGQPVKVLTFMPTRIFNPSGLGVYSPPESPTRYLYIANRGVETRRNKGTSERWIHVATEKPPVSRRQLGIPVGIAVHWEQP